MRICAFVLTVVMFAQQITIAQEVEKPVVTRAALDAALTKSVERRAQNLQQVRKLLADPEFARVTARLGDVRRLSDRLTVLDDRTLERLAKESDSVTQGGSGGRPGKVVIIIVLSLLIVGVVAAALAPESS